jgi:hypothetical protein
MEAPHHHHPARRPRDGRVLAPAPRAGDRQSPVLHVLRLRVPARGTSCLVVGDGSAPQPLAGGGGISGCAAIAADGRLLAAWFAHPAVPRPSVYAEWQALRLAMRLAAGYRPGTATLVTDNRSVATSAILTLAGSRPAAILGVHDPDAAAEIRGLAAARHPAITYRGGKPSGRLTAASPLGRTAHTAAWLVRRIAADGIDPAAHADWIAAAAARAPRLKDDLRRAYFRRFGRTAGAPGPLHAAAAGSGLPDCQAARMTGEPTAAGTGAGGNWLPLEAGSDRGGTLA